jgi:hypothetical protein
MVFLVELWQLIGRVRQVLEEACRDDAFWRTSRWEA